MRRVFSSTATAIAVNSGSGDIAPCRAVGRNMPTFVIPASVKTEMRHGSAMFNSMFFARTSPAWTGLHTSKMSTATNWDR